MTGQKNGRSPLVIGALGGSGTRVVAEIARQVGYYMGDDLNVANDNNWFTLLMKRPRWYKKHYRGNPAAVDRALQIFHRRMQGEMLDAAERLYVLRAALYMAVLGPKTQTGSWAIGPLFSFLGGGSACRSFDHWGWKEPNSHVFLEFLHRKYGEMRYVHVVRHGLDMAYSDNQYQLYNWGEMYGVSLSRKKKEMPKASLQYWIAANEKAVERGRALLGERFHLVSYDNLCLNPAEEIEKMLAFLGVGKGEVDLGRLAGLPKVPKSMNRYRRHDLSNFSADEVEAVRKFGFDVDLS